MARHDKILEHKTNCPACSHKFDLNVIQAIIQDEQKLEMLWLCDCEQRIRVVENVNGFLVMRKYIKRKDQVKRKEK